MYAHLVAGLDREQRTEFDTWLWSDPQREQAILRALA